MGRCENLPLSEDFDLRTGQLAVTSGAVKSSLLCRRSDEPGRHVEAKSGWCTLRPANSDGGDRSVSATTESDGIVQDPPMGGTTVHRSVSGWASRLPFPDRLGPL